MTERYPSSPEGVKRTSDLPIGDFEDWYWSYAYGSKNACINAVRRSDLPEDEKIVLIAMHEKNKGKHSPDE